MTKDEFFSQRAIKHHIKTKGIVKGKYQEPLVNPVTVSVNRKSSGNSIAAKALRQDLKSFTANDSFKTVVKRLNRSRKKS